jgi:hypothetical protein
VRYELRQFRRGCRRWLKFDGHQIKNGLASINHDLPQILSPTLIIANGTCICFSENSENNSGCPGNQHSATMLQYVYDYEFMINSINKDIGIKNAVNFFKSFLKRKW